LLLSYFHKVSLFGNHSLGISSPFFNYKLHRQQLLLLLEHALFGVGKTALCGAPR
jgi:hypothetical protein